MPGSGTAVPPDVVVPPEVVLPPEEVFPPDDVLEVEVEHFFGFHLQLLVAEAGEDIARSAPVAAAIARTLRIFIPLLVA